MLIRERHVAAPSGTRLVAAAETLSRNAISLAVTQPSRVRPARAAVEEYGTTGATEATAYMGGAAAVGASGWSLAAVGVDAVAVCGGDRHGVMRARGRCGLFQAFSEGVGATANEPHGE